MWHVATIWHHEPGDRDSGEVCKGRHTLRWGWEHRSHCRVRVTAFGRYVRWYRDRCDSCGYRFALKEGRYGTWGGDEVFHYRCQAADTAGRQLNDAYAYMAHRELGHAVDWNVKWRVERELARRQEIEVEFDKIGEPS